MPYYQSCSRRVHKRKEYAFSTRFNFNGAVGHMSRFKHPFQMSKSGNSIIMFTGMEGAAQSVLVVHWSVLEALHLELSEASELHCVRGNQWCIFGPLGQEHIVSPFLNEKWTVGEIKLRGVEWGTVEAPDTNSPPRPGPAIAAPRSQRAQLLQL